MPKTTFDRPIYRTLFTAGQVLLGALTILLAIVGQYWDAVSSATLLGLSFAYRLSDERLPSLFALLFVGIALINAVGWGAGLYYHWNPYFDKAVHLLTTGTLALVLVRFLDRGSLRRELGAHPWTVALAVATLALGLGAIWEIWEYTAELLFGGQIVLGIADTIGDLAADFAGALLAATLSARRWREHKSPDGHDESGSERED